MKKNILILFLFLFNMHLFSKNLDVFLNFSLYLSEPLFFSREITIEYLPDCEKCSFTYSMGLEFEAFNNILWGNTNRISMDCKFYFLLFKEIFIKSGPGIGYANSFGAQGVAPDIIMNIYYKIFFINTKTSIFQNGFFNKNIFGIKINIANFAFKLGLNNVLVSDYKSYYFIYGLLSGAGYEF